MDWGSGGSAAERAAAQWGPDTYFAVNLEPDNLLLEDENRDQQLQSTSEETPERSQHDLVAGAFASTSGAGDEPVSLVESLSNTHFASLPSPSSSSAAGGTVPVSSLALGSLSGVGSPSPVHGSLAYGGHGGGSSHRWPGASGPTDATAVCASGSGGATGGTSTSGSRGGGGGTTTGGGDDETLFAGTSGGEATSSGEGTSGVGVGAGGGVTSSAASGGAVGTSSSAQGQSSASGSGPGSGSSPSGRSMKKPRLVWTAELHSRFMNAVNHLGVKNAVPKTILQLMNVEGMTRENVASHLQKYRLHLRRSAGISSSARLPSDTVPHGPHLYPYVHQPHELPPHLVMPAQPMPGPTQTLQQLAQHHHPYGSPLHRTETGAMLATTSSTAMGLPGLATRLDPSSAAAYVRGPGPAIAPPPVVCAGPTAGYPLGPAACGPSLSTGPGFGQVFSFPQPPGATLRQPWESLSSPGTAGRAASSLHYRPSPATGVTPVIPPVYHTSTPHNHPSNPPAHHLQVGLGGVFSATPGAGPSAPAVGIGSCLPSPSRSTLGASPIIGSASSTSLPGAHGIMLGHQSTPLPIGGMHPGPSWLTDTTAVGGSAGAGGGGAGGGAGGAGGSPWHDLGGEWKKWTDAGGSPGETFGSGSQSRSPSGGSGTLAGGCSGSTGTTHKRDQW